MKIAHGGTGETKNVGTREVKGNWTMERKREREEEERGGGGRKRGEREGDRERIPSGIGRVN